VVRVRVHVCHTTSMFCLLSMCEPEWMGTRLRRPLAFTPPHKCVRACVNTCIPITPWSGCAYVRMYRPLVFDKSLAAYS
jgi:hypothetical protein